MMDTIDLKLYEKPKDKLLDLEGMTIQIARKKAGPLPEPMELDEAELTEIFNKYFSNQYFRVGHKLRMEYKMMEFKLVIKKTDINQINRDGQKFAYDAQDPVQYVPNKTNIEWVRIMGDPHIKMKAMSNKTKKMFKRNFSFGSMGIGGLNTQLTDIFRRCFATRRFPPSLLKKFGIKHTKGLMLHGPPGTGKTMIARELSKALHAKEPKIVNGPEVMSKWQGESANNIRKLFAEAEKDQKELGDESELHVIIFDEIDSICR